MMHTCLALGISMSFGPKNVRLDAVGTHLVENAIGIARSISNSTKYESICSAFAIAELRKEIAKNYDIKLHILKRIDDGGSKIDTLCDEGLKHPEWWDAHDLVATCVEICSYDTRETCEAELLKFTQDLSDVLGRLQVQELRETSEVANSLILQRSYKFKAVTDVEGFDDE